MTRIFAVMFIALNLTAPARAGEKPKKADRDASRTVEAYLAAVLAGKVDTAAVLALPRSVEGSKERIMQYKQRIAAKSIKLASTHVSALKGRAFAVTAVVKLTKEKPDDPDKGLLVIKLSKTDGRWLVRDVDFKTDEVAKQQLKQFLERYKDAKAVPDEQEKK